jgi:alkylation response protein AidB-like acyl-CoA dehydrogenase
MLRPHFAPDLPRPIAVIEGNPDRAVRFLPVAKSVIAIGDDGVRTAVLGNHASETVESLFAYPMGRLADAAMEWTVHDTDPKAVRDSWRVAVGAEIAGSLKGGLEAVLAYVRDRRQFGRSLGSFQAVQHRLAEAAVTIEAAYLLILKAAQSGDGIDSALALGYVQDASNRIVYDFHQFMGAMGLTLEHPLHRWTYRVKLLKSSLGGGSENLKRAADRRWS